LKNAFAEVRTLAKSFWSRHHLQDHPLIGP
jgi:hypothetical protein